MLSLYMLLYLWGEVICVLPPPAYIYAFVVIYNSCLIIFFAYFIYIFISVCFIIQYKFLLLHDTTSNISRLVLRTKVNLVPTTTSPKSLVYSRYLEPIKSVSNRFPNCGIYGWKTNRLPYFSTFRSFRL